MHELKSLLKSKKSEEKSIFNRKIVSWLQSKNHFSSYRKAMVTNIFVNSQDKITEDTERMFVIRIVLFIMFVVSFFRNVCPKIRKSWTLFNFMTTITHSSAIVNDELFSHSKQTNQKKRTDKICLFIFKILLIFGAYVRLKWIHFVGLTLKFVSINYAVPFV